MKTERERPSDRLRLEEYYRYLESDSVRLLRLLNHPKPFAKTLAAISGGSPSLAVASPEDAARLESLAYSFASNLWQRVSPDYSIPLLMQSVNDFYYGSQTKRQPLWAGTALKTSITLVWGNVHHGRPGRLYSLERLADGVAAAAVFEQLHILQDIYMAGGDGSATLHSDSFSLSEAMSKAAEEINITFMKRGLLHRMLGDCFSAIWQQPAKASASFVNILRGQRPADQEGFSGTVFSEIPVGEPIEFWAGLCARFGLAAEAANSRRHIRPNPAGISLFSTYGRSVGDDDWMVPLNKAILGLAWDRDWYLRWSRTETANMIVYRPVVPLTASSGQFVTSFLHAADSLNWFVEASVMQYDIGGSIRLSQDVKQRVVDRKFEETVKKAFTERGFRAGEVTESAFWKLEPKGILLQNDTKYIPPGQIDLLAYHETARLVVVGECKVLGIPHTSSAVRNIVQKIGELDDKEYHSRLRRKTRWIRETTAFRHLPEESFVGMIILDRAFPGMRRGEHIVSDLNALGKDLDQFLNPVNPS